ncbi:hypothetical protein [Leptospira bouyouniensis]|uniref:DUF4376 domain-containing protein n=1 Tax=Leptospira bouyouniensis TaxID=2484911 RepID=A0ABY2L242_9LEPT|nr:hypothetical protein [Leptospira bouyouniensis]TGK45522.1 hypothetical protein EHQ10_18925 [Leptospira bouyouniensis]
MKNVTIRNKEDSIISDLNLYDDPTEFIVFNVGNNTWGKPERLVREKILIENSYSYLDELYDESDVISRSEEIIDGESVHFVTLRADYSISIEEYQPSNEELILEIKLRILKHAEAVCEEGVQFLNYQFQAREIDCTRMNNSLKKIEIGGVWRGTWRDRNNAWRELTFNEFKELALKAGDYCEDIFRIARDLIDELSNLPFEDLRDYDLIAKWNYLINDIEVP